VSVSTHGTKTFCHRGHRGLRENEGCLPRSTLKRRMLIDTLQSAVICEICGSRSADFFVLTVRALCVSIQRITCRPRVFICGSINDSPRLGASAVQPLRPLKEKGMNRRGAETQRKSEADRRTVMEGLQSPVPWLLLRPAAALCPLWQLLVRFAGEAQPCELRGSAGASPSRNAAAHIDGRPQVLKSSSP